MGGVLRVPSRSVILAAACAATLSLTAASCGDEPSTVAVGEAVRGTVLEVVDAPAAVTARAAATLTAPADGTLAELRVRPGDQVAAGQVLAVIDSPSAQNRLKQARRALNAARRTGGGGTGSVDLTGVRRDTDRQAAAAFDTARDAAGKISDEQVRDALLAQVDSARQRYAAASAAADAAVQAVRQGVASLNSAMSALGAAQRLQAQQAFDLAKATTAALTLRAPIAGVVQLGGVGATGAAPDSLTDLLAAAGGSAPGGAPAAGLGGSGGQPLPGVDGSVPVGGIVAAGTPVLTVVDTGQLGLLAEVDETDVLLVTPGVAASVELDAATGASYEAAVTSVDVLPTSSARGGVAYRVRLSLGAGRFPDGRPAPTPRPGMSAVAHLNVRQAAGTLTVPASAVFSSEGRDSVWVVRDGHAERVEVTLGVQGQDVVEVVSGVVDGQEVVVRGADQVVVGQQLP